MVTKHLKGIKNPKRKKINILGLAKTAYETYAQQALKGAAYGNVMPIWDDLFPNQKKAWYAVVKKLNGLV